jgi:hypothetical protein
MTKAVIAACYVKYLCVRDPTYETDYNFLSFPELSNDLLTCYQTEFEQGYLACWFIYDSLDL